mgnify:CR=1 FL=1|nr:MAG TPA: hypothetical protein [Caudoviricetes sp.]
MDNSKKEYKNILPPIAESFTEIKDLSLDLIEIPFDLMIENPIVQSIPIVRTVAGVIKFGINVRERYLLKKTLVFLSTMNNSNMTQDEIERYKNELLTSPEKLEKELGRAVLLLDRQIDIEKSKMLGNFYIHFIKGNINWDKFCELSSILDSILIQDIKRLDEVIDKDNISKQFKGNIEEQRLASYGLLKSINHTMYNMGNGTSYIISDLGKEFVKYNRYS